VRRFAREEGKGERGERGERGKDERLKEGEREGGEAGKTEGLKDGRRQRRTEEHEGATLCLTDRLTV
jgi:hypothetical protein